MKAIQKLMTVGAMASVLGMVCATSMAAADDPKPAPQPVAPSKPARTVVTPPPKAVNKVKVFRGRSPVGDYGYVILDPVDPEALKKATAGWGISADTLNEVEGGGARFRTLTQAVYEADRHTAEKIKARVQAADEKAKVLLRGGAPSHVLK